MSIATIKNSTPIQTLVNYFIVFTVFFPRGLFVFNQSYTIFTILTWTSVILIIFILFKDRKTIHNQIKKHSLAKQLLIASSFFVYTLINTILNKGNLSNGLQELIAYPIFFSYFLYSAKKDSKLLINNIINIVTFLLVLNLITMELFTSNHVHMLLTGHVQTISQICIIGILSIVYAMKKYNKSKLFSALSIITIFTNLFIADASSAQITAIALLFFLLLSRTKLYTLINLSPRLLIILCLLSNLFIPMLSIYNNTNNHNEIELLDFSGRSFVWKDTTNKILDNPITGYGVNGIEIDVFWNTWQKDIGSLFYTHNQLLQCLLDGGIISTILFYAMMYICIRSFTLLSRTSRYRYLFSSTFICYAMIMSVESPIIYPYIFIFLALLYTLPKEASKRTVIE